MRLKAIVKSLLKNAAPYGVVTGLEWRLQSSDTSFANSDTSFANEEATLDWLAREIGLVSSLGSPERSWVVDIGASDGVTQSSTKKFAYEYGWNGCMIECDSLKFSALSSLYSRHDRVSLVKSKVAPFNIVSMLSACNVPRSFSILNLDIDSWDLPVIEALLSSGYEPSLITMEINEKIPESIFFSVKYNPEHVWRADHFYGCSLSAASRVVKQYGYSLAAVEWNNAFFVKQSSGKAVSDLSVAEAFRGGYSSREDRLTVFPWNSDVDYWHSLRAADAVNEIKNYFSAYDQGLYDLRIDPA